MIYFTTDKNEQDDESQLTVENSKKWLLVNTENITLQKVQKMFTSNFPNPQFLAFELFLRQSPSFLPDTESV